MSGIFNIVRGRRDSGINFGDIILPLTQADSYHSDSSELLEPGIYCKHPRVTVIKSKQDALVNINIYQLKELIKARNKSQDRTPMWVDLQGMDDEALGIVADAFGLHPLTLEDCIVADTLEKIETRHNYIFMVMSDVSVQHNESGHTAVNLNIMIFPDLILTIHSKPVHSVYAVVPKLEYCTDTRVPSIEFVLYIILVRMLDYFEAYINKLNTEAEDLDEVVLSLVRINYKDTSDLLGRIGGATKQTSSLLDGLSTKAEIFTALMRQDIFSSNGMRYIKNANDQVLKMCLKVSLARDMLTDINTLYMSKLSVQLSLISNEVGVLMRRFGVIGTVFLPANLLAGIFGMNVLLPGESGTNTTPHAFITILFVMVGISMLQMTIFYYLKWL